MASAAQQSYDIWHHRSASAMLLSQLKGAHDRLLHEMENMDRIVRGPLPATSELSAARWRISHASLKRRNLSASIFDFLAHGANESEAAALGKLRVENQAAMARSARHVYRWTLQAIGEDWQGYGQASSDIRMEMKANILLEQQLLYPILESLAARGL